MRRFCPLDFPLSDGNYVLTVGLEGATTTAAAPADSEEEVTTTVPGDDTTDPS